MKSTGKFRHIVKITVSSVLTFSAVFCIAQRLPECFASQAPAVLAASFTLADGNKRLPDNSKSSADDTEITTTAPESNSTTLPKTTDDKAKVRDKSGYYDSFADHSGEQKFEIAENTYFGGADRVKNFFVKNKTGVDFDFESILNTPLTFNADKNSNEPQVLIYHTHTTEGYMDEDVDYFYDSFYSRTEDESFSVVAVGDAIASSLEQNGIKVYHDKTIHDATYDGAYDRSAETVKNDMKKYKNIKVVLDIHRDAIGTDERKIKPVFTYNGKKGAQIMILSGCDDGSNWFPNWQNNLGFALKLQSKAEEMYEGMTRPLCFDYFRYNEYVCDGSLLIEVGTEANSIDEVEYTGKLLGNVISQVICQ